MRGTLRAVERTGGRAVGRVLLAAVLLSARPPVRLSAQLSVQPCVGLRYTSTLAHDFLVTPFDVRPALAPAIALTLAAPLQRRWTAQASLDFSTSELERHDADGTSADLGRLSVLALTVGLRRPLRGGFTVGAAVGGLKYLPAGETGIFRSGADGVFALAGAVASYTPSRAVGRWQLGVEARYDVHRFITPALRSEGFTSARTVHRVALALRAARAAS